MALVTLLAYTGLCGSARCSAVRGAPGPRLQGTGSCPERKGRPQRQDGAHRARDAGARYYLGGRAAPPAR